MDLRFAALPAFAMVAMAPTLLDATAAVERWLRPHKARPAITSPVFHTLAANPDLELPLPAPPACDRGRRGLASVARAEAWRLSRQRIPYNSIELSDCSGMAHRWLDALVDRCDGVEKPPVTVARSARALAAWYAHRGRLARVDDPLDVDDALTPGALVFFGAPGRTEVALDEIFHMGMVFGVSRDAVGRVESYRLFHALRPGKVASITRWHRRTSEPPFGNGNERLVAVAWPSAEMMPAGMGAVTEVPGAWAARSLQ